MSDDLLIKFLLKETSPEEDVQVQGWLAEDPENQKEFSRFELIWNSSKDLELESTVDTGKAWEHFQTRIPSDSEDSGVHPLRRNFSWLRIAAVLFIIAGAWLFYSVLSGPSYNIISSGQMVRTETLPDGSRVTLNKNAVLSYKKDFTGNTRSVRLDHGEVFFDVSPDKSKPFIIEADQVSIRVLGTSFNVKQINSITEVIVESGRVQVSMDEQNIELRKGEKVLIKAGDAVLRKELSGDQLYNYYRTRVFVAENTPLWRVVEILNEAYQSNIIIENRELRELTLNATFRDESLDTILHVIAETFKASLVKEDGKIILK